MDDREHKDKNQPKPKGLAKWESNIDDAIRQAMEQGLFDNLPGKGKPQDLSRNPFVGEEWDAAYRMLQGAGFAPEWIEEEKAIRQDEEAIRGRLARAWDWYQNRLIMARNDGERLRLAGHWQQAQVTFRQQVVDLNRRIDIFNLKVPVIARQRFRIRPDEEIRKLDPSYWAPLTYDSRI